MPGRSKLRSTCNACGNAKLKCDRAHPHCGRCVSLGIECVYSVSMKSSKKTWRALNRISSSQHANSPQTGTSMHTGPSMASVQWSPYIAGVNGGNDLGFTMAEPSIEGYNPDPLSMISNDSPLPMAYSIPGGYGTVPGGFLPSPASATMLPLDQFPMGNLVTTAAGTDHGCPQEAYALLGRLSFIDRKAPSLQDTVNGLPLDKVLALNREACNTLGRLFTCHCARCPQLALQYAAIFDKVMIRYQQAAGCFKKSTSSLWDASAGTNSGCVFASSSSVNVAPHSVDSDFRGAGLADVNSPPQVNAVPSNTLTMGSFSIDDQRVQAALKIQLVLSEMKRAGSVIDLFASQSFESSDSTNGNLRIPAESLYRTMSTWLRGEHERIIEIMVATLDGLK